MKTLYSISELAEMGYSRSWLYAAAHCVFAKNYCVGIDTGRRRKIYFYLDKLKEWTPSIYLLTSGKKKETNEK